MVAIEVAPVAWHTGTNVVPPTFNAIPPKATQLAWLLAEDDPAARCVIIPSALDQVRGAPSIIIARIMADARRRALDIDHWLIVDDALSKVRAGRATQRTKQEQPTRNRCCATKDGDDMGQHAARFEAMLVPWRRPKLRPGASMVELQGYGPDF
jgi:hypothetical protein